MNLSRPVIVMALGLGLLSTGCLGSTEPFAPGDLQAPRFETLGPNDNDVGGTTGANGLKTSYFHAKKLQLLAATGSRLLTNGTTQVSSEVIATGLLQSVAGRDVFHYALACAGPPNVILHDANGFTYEIGEPILGTTSAWSTGALGHSAKMDLFACMLAHLNPSGAEVSILVAGEAVDFQPGQDQSAYTFDEGLWNVKLAADGSLQLYVWPMGDLEDSCTWTALVGKIQTRICGFGLGSTPCALHIMDRYDPVHGCTKSEEGFFECDGQQALQTRLDPDDVSVLYGGCIP